MMGKMKVDDSVEPVENEYGQGIWDEVARRLSREGFSGLVLNVVSGFGAPFTVVASGAEGPARSVVNPGFREKLTRVVREVIASRAAEPELVLSRGGDWPPFSIELSDDFDRNDPPPASLPDPWAPPRFEKAPESREAFALIPPAQPLLTCVHEPSESSLRRIACELGDLVVAKNQAYGNSVATSAVAMSLLYPDGVRSDQLGDMLILVRIWDKMKRIATKKDAFGESPFRDIVGYALLGAEKDEAGGVDFFKAVTEESD